MANWIFLPFIVCSAHSILGEINSVIIILKIIQSALHTCSPKNGFREEEKNMFYPMHTLTCTLHVFYKGTQTKYFSQSLKADATRG